MKGGGLNNLTITSHHAGMAEGGAKRFTAEGNFSELWMSHYAADALIRVSDPAQCSNTSYPGSLLSAARLVHLLHVHSHTCTCGPIPLISTLTDLPCCPKNSRSAQSETEGKQREVVKIM